MNIEAEWIEHNGSCKNPVNVDCLVDICAKTYTIYRTTADCVDWISVLSYRLHEPFRDAPDEATHLLGYKDKREFVRLISGSHYGYNCDGTHDNGLPYCVSEHDWKVIATRKKEEPEMIGDMAIYKLPDTGVNVYEPEYTGGSVTANSTVQAALRHMQDRAATYDKPTGERSMSSTVEAFNAISGHILTEEQGWMFMALLKIVRSQQGGFKADNYEDLAAYAGLMAESGSVARNK